MSPSVQAIRRFLEAHDRFAAHNGITVEDADYDYGKVSLAFEDHAKNSLDMLPVSYTHLTLPTNSLV